jgi:hypothetical protein
MECNYVLMTYIRDSIQNMDKQNHIEVLKMLKKHNNIVINSNKSGIRINLSELNNDIINELLNYIKHIQMLEKNLNVLERQKEEITNDFF